MENQTETVNSASDTNADKEGEQGQAGLTSKSIVQSADAAKGKGLSPEEKVQKRINQIIAQKKGLEGDNNELRDKLASLEKELTNLKTVKTTKFTDSQLEQAIKKGIEENNPEIISEAVRQLTLNNVNEHTEKQKAETRTVEERKAYETQVLGRLVQTYPEMQDVNSTLRKAANQLFESDPALKQRGADGMFAATSQAYRILTEEGLMGNDGIRTRVMKSEMRNNLGSGNASGGEEGDEGGGGAELTDGEKAQRFVEQSRKNNEKYFEKIESIKTNSKSR